MRTTLRRGAPRGHDGGAHDRGGYGAAGMARQNAMLMGRHVASSRMEAR